MRVVQQGEAFAVQSQKSESGQVKKCHILLQEFGGKYADQYACTMLGNAATCRFSRDELVAVSLRFTVNEYEGFGCLPCSKIAQGEALFIVVKVVLVVFPTQQAVSKQHDTTLESLHLRIKKLYSYE